VYEDPGLATGVAKPRVGLAETTRKEFFMGFRRRTRRRALIAGAAVAHHENKKYNEQQGYDDQASQGYDDPAPEQYAPAPAAPQYAPPPPSSTDEIEHLAQLHDSGVLTDEEFSAAKAKALGI
jgi:hypothetical protein